VSALLVAVATMMVLAGLVLAVAGIRPTPIESGTPRRERKTAPRTSTRTRQLLAGGIVAGIVVWLLSGWAIAVLILPAAALILPTLVTASPGTDTIARLEGMQAWTRALTGVLDVGVGLEQAIVAASVRATPPAIATEVGTLVARIRARTNIESALRAFAADLADSTGDVIVIALLAGAHRRGQGLVTVLEALADTVADEVRIRRTVEAERAPGRSAARWVTIISISFLAVLFLASNYMAPYKSGLGQLLLGLYLAVYLILLRWMQSMAKPTPLPRFIGDHLRTRPRHGALT